MMWYVGGYRDYIGIMEKKMETTVAYWGYIGFRVYLLFSMHHMDALASDFECQLSSGSIHAQTMSMLESIRSLWHPRTGYDNVHP